MSAPLERWLCYYYYPIVFLSPSVFTLPESIAAPQFPPKCCTLTERLTYNGATETFACTTNRESERQLVLPPLSFPSNESHVLRLSALENHGLPECENGTLVSAPAEIGTRVLCLDKLKGRRSGEETLVGLTCGLRTDEGEVVEDLLVGLYEVPDVYTINKCCPLERRYANPVEGCWSADVPDDRSNFRRLLEELVEDADAGYVDLRVGAPACGRDEVLVNMVLPTSYVRRADSDSLNVTLLGRRGHAILPPESVCVDFYGNDRLTFVVRACQDRTITCRQRTCVNKCCPDGQSMFDHNSCVRSKSKFDPKFYELAEGNRLTEATDDINPAMSYGMDCDKYILLPDDYTDDVSYLTVGGKLYFPSDETLVGHYCIDVLTSIILGNITTFATFLCFLDKQTDGSTVRDILFYLKNFGLIVSCFFLFLTLFVYLCLPSLRNVHGKTLMCYVASLLAAYLCLSFSQIGSVLNILENETKCRAVGYLTLFAFLAAFSWLNVLCFDIWYTFGTVRSSFIRKRKRSNRFTMYNLYCWSFAGAVTLAAVGADFAAKHGLISHIYVSDVGVSNCWINPHNKGVMIYFVMPVGFQLISNAVLFVLTTRHCLKVKSEIARMHNNSTAKMRYNHDKRKLVMTVKLFVVMGIVWTAEILSQFISPFAKWWYPSDAFNILQGILIFIIFIFKKKIIYGIRNRMIEFFPCCFNKQTKVRASTLNSSSVFTTSSSECKIQYSAKQN